MRTELLPREWHAAFARSLVASWNSGATCSAVTLANGGPVKKNLLGLALLFFLLPAGSGWAQTLDLSGKPQDQAPKSQQKQSTNRKQSAGRASAAPGICGTSGVGWGGSIEAGRYARAAENALKNGNPGGAMNYAQHLTQVAPSDA